MTEPVASARSDRAVFGVVFSMLFAFSYSEQLISGLYPVVGQGGQPGWRIAVIVVDAVVLGLVGLMKRSITRTDGDSCRLWVWWWAGVGAGGRLRVERSRRDLPSRQHRPRCLGR